jgi:hydroxymethylpyrimidine/phosphomethylpyrimidine kinase
VLVTGVMLPAKGAEQFIDNVLASPQGIADGSEKFELLRHLVFVGAGDTLAAALAAAAGLPAANWARPPWAKRWAFLDQLPGRRLPPRHGQRRARPLLLGPAAA